MVQAKNLIKTLLPWYFRCLRPNAENIVESPLTGDDDDKDSDYQANSDDEEDTDNDEEDTDNDEEDTDNDDEEDSDNDEEEYLNNANVGYPDEIIETKYCIIVKYS